MKILTAAQMREVDRLSTEQFGVPSILLMENAGIRVVEAIESRFENLGSLAVAVLCGKGNNGGDGFVAARHLLQKGCVPFVYLFADDNQVRGDARVNLDMLRGGGAPPTVVLSDEDWNREKLEILDADVIIDALIGTGLTKPVTGLYKNVIDSLSSDFAAATVFAVDVPSGLAADSPDLEGSAVQADVTVTFSALKPCLVLPPSHRVAGEIVVAEIGNPTELLEREDFQLNLITSESFPAAYHRRSEDSNKGSYGKILIVAGSRGKSGAAVMSGQAALRSGAGLVTVATVASVLPIVASSMPELMTEPLEETGEGAAANQSISRLLENKTVLALGPGLGSNSETKNFVRSIVRDVSIPIVIDADGLNAFVDELDDLPAEAVLTPHPGEMGRLVGKDAGWVNRNRIDVARDFAARRNVFVVLKGFRTVIAAPDGSIFINPTGNPGMATGGTGDILTGMVAGILGQEHLGTFVERLCLAVYLHGLAADLCAESYGEEAMIATDILKFIGAAWKQMRGDSSHNH